MRELNVFNLLLALGMFRAARANVADDLEFSAGRRLGPFDGEHVDPCELQDCVEDSMIQLAGCQA